MHQLGRAQMIRKLIEKLRRRYVYKSALTGKFVSKAYAAANPVSASA